MRIFALLVLCSVVAATDRVVLYNRRGVPSGYSLQDEKPSPSHVITFHVALKQNEQGVADMCSGRFWEISDPTSSKYGLHLSAEEIDSSINPSQGDHDTVVGWLVEGGCSVESFGDSLRVHGSVEHVEQLFQSVFASFVHENKRDYVLAHQGELSVPAEISIMIDFVSGLGQFPIPRLNKAKSSSSDAPTYPRSDLLVVPETLMEQYNVQFTRKVSQNHFMTILETVPVGFPSGFEQSAVDTFNTEIGDGKAKPAITKLGPFDATSSEVEFTLDPEYMQAFGPDVPVTYESHIGWVYEWTVSVFNRTKIPSVASLSAGWSEDDQCEIAGPGCQLLGVDSHQYVQRTNTELCKLGLRGVTLLASAGDSGAAGRTNGACSDTSVQPVHAAFPASSPYVTAVGGTQFSKATALSGGPKICTSGAGEGKCAGTGTEVAWGGQAGGGATGGGFSDISPQPSYQQAAVAEWLAGSALRPPAQFFNTTGRAYPDISAMAIQLVYEFGGEASVGGGTSFSSPILAGLIGRLNGERIAEGKSPLGHLNPFLYQLAAKDPSAFTDITEGDNRATEQSECDIGYGASKGWDPVTGLGTFNYAKISDYAANLPAGRPWV